MSEQFNNVEPFLDDHGDVVMEIETRAEDFPRQVGKLWTGASWLSVAEARRLHAWLGTVIPQQTRIRVGIRVDAVQPPIPTHQFDYSAVDDSTYEGDPRQPVGYGPTPEAAIADLKEQMEQS